MLDRAWEEGIMENDAGDDDEDVWNNVVMDDGIQFDGPTTNVSDEPQVETNLDQMLREGGRDLTDERDIKKFKRLKEDARKPLYAGCNDGDSRVHTTLSLLQLKARNGWSDKSFGELLGVIKKLLPEENAHYYRNLNQGGHNGFNRGGFCNRLGHKAMVNRDLYRGGHVTTLVNSLTEAVFCVMQPPRLLSINRGGLFKKTASVNTY